MDRYLQSGDFVAEDTTAFKKAPEDEYREPGIFVQGAIACLGNLVLSVNKFLRILGDPENGNPMVETKHYKYNLSVHGYGTVFRYDNGHPWYLHPRHRDPHHKHLFDWQAGKEIRPPSPLWIGADDWPHLHRVIEEVREWHYLHRHLLPEPDAFPPLDSAR